MDTIGTQLAVLYTEVSLIWREFCTLFCIVGTADSVHIREVSFIQSEVSLYVPAFWEWPSHRALAYPNEYFVEGVEWSHTTAGTALSTSWLQTNIGLPLHRIPHILSHLEGICWYAWKYLCNKNFWESRECCHIRKPTFPLSTYLLAQCIPQSHTRSCHTLYLQRHVKGNQALSSPSAMAEFTQKQ